MPRRHGPNGKQAARARERERLAFELYKAGATHEQIAARLPPHMNEDGTPGKLLTKQAVGKMIRRVIAQLATDTLVDAEDVRRVELERINTMLLGLWERARSGDLEAVDRAIKLGKRRSELLGLDAPNKQAISGPNNGPIGIESAVRIYLPDNGRDKAT